MEETVRGGGGQQCEHGVRTGGFAEDGDVVRVAAERGDVAPHPLQGRHLVAQAEVVVERPCGRGEFAEVDVAEGAEPVVQRHDHHVAAQRQSRAGVQAERGGAHHVAAAVDEHHHRTRGDRRGRGHDDIQCQRILAGRLIGARADTGTAAMLERRRGELGRVPHARPGLHRLRGAEAQLAHRWRRVGQGPPAQHPASAATADDPVGGRDVDRCHHRSIVTSPGRPPTDATRSR
ncbi:Uncharacterised protein [Mycobacteroides abscessus subsp. abscessus]|nr:Uncharacterised protein [Mycobacteroides abscessus subsp. abscessus]